jgi:hypothetical protein
LRKQGNYEQTAIGMLRVHVILTFGCGSSQSQTAPQVTVQKLIHPLQAKHQHTAAAGMHQCAGVWSIKRAEPNN